MVLNFFVKFLSFLLHNVSQCVGITSRRNLIMRLQIIKSKNAQSLYVVKSVYRNKKRTNKVVEKLGTYEKLKQNLNEDPIEWAKKYVEELNKQEKTGTRNVLVKYNPSKNN